MPDDLRDSGTSARRAVVDLVDYAIVPASQAIRATPTKLEDSTDLVRGPVSPMSMWIISTREESVRYDTH